MRSIPVPSLLIDPLSSLYSKLKLRDAASPLPLRLASSRTRNRFGVVSKKRDARSAADFVKGRERWILGSLNRRSFAKRFKLRGGFRLAGANALAFGALAEKGKGFIVVCGRF